MAKVMGFIGSASAIVAEANDLSMVVSVEFVPPYVTSVDLIGYSEEFCTWEPETIDPDKTYLSDVETAPDGKTYVEYETVYGRYWVTFDTYEEARDNIRVVIGK